MSLERYEKFLSLKRASQELHTEKKEKISKEINDMEIGLSYLEEALNVMNTVGVLAQGEFKDVFEQLVTQALQFVFGEAYSFKMENVISRNQPETRIYAVVDGIEYLLKDADEELGFGVVDVVSFVLRLICWAIQYPSSRNCFIIDEPFRNLDTERMPQMGEVIHNLWKMFNTQYIIITHRKELIDIADRGWGIEKKNGVSKVEVLV